jgi:hypothetical protein
MATVTSYTSAAIDASLAAKADLAGGVLLDSQSPSNAVKKDTWVVDLNDHGGNGNGVASNDAAFISALAAINPTWGGKIVLRAGFYVISGSTAITLSNFGTILEGAGAEATKIIIGSGFTGSSAISITGKNCRIDSLSIVGSNSTTTSNPVANAISISSAQRTRISKCNFGYINGWAIKATAGSTSGTDISGTKLSDLYITACAAGIYFIGNSGSGTVSSFLSDIHITVCGVTSGGSAGLDGIRIEDAVDVLAENIISWLSSSTGHAIHVVGACKQVQFNGVDAQGSTSSSTILIEDGANGSPYNTLFVGGTVQTGTTGVRVTGAANIVHFEALSIINNQAHGMSIEGSGNPIFAQGLYFALNGAGASGTNYDINWSGSSIGHLSNCRFETAIVSSGTAGVQKTINVPVTQNVRCINVMFAGTGSNSTNWFTNLPHLVMETSGGYMNFVNAPTMSSGLFSLGSLQMQPSASGNDVLSSNIGGVAAFATFRITGDGNINIGPAAGTGARDTTWGRISAAAIGTSDSDVIINLAGKGLKIKEGTNARMGTATLVAGAVTVANTSVTANTRVVLAVKTPSATAANNGALFVYSLTIGTGFVVHSTNASDTSVIGYVLFEAA